MKSLVIGNQSFSIIDPDVLSDEDIEMLDARGPDELEEDARADEIEVTSGVRLRHDKEKHDDYEEGIDELTGLIDEKYFGDS